MERLPNLDDLKPYRSDQKKSFEELCYQIVAEEFRLEGTLTSIDDSGGGDGVEFYIERQNGDVWGWQCKFFARFKEGSRKKQIKKSLHRAYEKHGKKLKKWFLCSKSSLTPQEKDWFNHKLAASILNSQPVLPIDHEVTLEHWGDSKIQNYLRQHPDIYRYFFSDKILTPTWFKEKAQVVLSSSTIQSKYIEELHIESSAEKTVAKVLGGRKLLNIIQNLVDEHQINLSTEESLEEETCVTFPEVAEEFSGIRDQVQELVSANNYIIGDGVVLLMKTVEWLALEDQSKMAEIQEFAIAYLERLENFYVDYSRILHPVSFFVHNKESNEQRKAAMKECLNALSGPYITFNQDHHSFEEIFNSLIRLDQRELHITGDASKGKTHLSIDIFKTHIDEDKPAILLLGKDFKSNAPLGEQIKQLLDVPSDWSLGDFLGALNTAAKVKNAKAILLIDGLNESVYWRDIWGNALENLITEIKLKYSNLLLITTYRTSYEEQLFPKHYFTSSPEAHDTKVEVYGYNHFNVHEAVIRYFTYYDITLTNHSNTFNHFAEPLYLKIFCETKQGQTVSFADDDLFEVLDQYLQRCNENILHLLNKEPRHNKYFLQNKLSVIADYLWASNSRDIPLSEVVGNVLEEDQLVFIEHENLLIFRDWDQHEVFSFTYDLLSGYLIATQLVEKLSSEDELDTFIGSADFNNKLLRSSTQHPLYSDILRCFCVLAIKKFGLAGFAKLDSPKLLRYVLISLYEINAEYVKSQAAAIKKFITLTFEKTDNQELIFAQSSSVEFDTQHPLNFAFTSSLIKQLSVADRDLGWTEFIRKNYSSYSEYDIKKFLRDFEQAVKGGKELSDRIHLEAEKVKWLLTSTNRELRDTATRALYFYGRQFPTDFSTLVFESLSINDPYVWERTLASLYGVVMAEHNSLTSSKFRDNILPDIGRELYKLIFQENAPYATTHILARDYAKRIIDICLLYYHKQFSTTEIQSLRKPYKGGIRDWGEYDFNYEEHSYGGPIHMDFSNYTIGTIVKDGGSYSDPPEKQKVRRQIYWRIFDLGWQENRFKEAERAIGNQNHSRSDQAKIERYGKSMFGK